MNHSTLEKLFRQHHARLLAKVRAMLYDDAEAEDVVSELFAELLRRLPKVKAGRELAYLCESVRWPLSQRTDPQDADGARYKSPVDVWLTTKKGKGVD